MRRIKMYTSEIKSWNDSKIFIFDKIHLLFLWKRVKDGNTTEQTVSLNCNIKVRIIIARLDVLAEFPHFWTVTEQRQGRTCNQEYSRRNGKAAGVDCILPGLPYNLGTRDIEWLAISMRLIIETGTKPGIWVRVKVIVMLKHGKSESLSHFWNEYFSNG